MSAAYDKSEPNGAIVSLALALTTVILTLIFVYSIYLYKIFITAEQDAQIQSPTSSWATAYREDQIKDLNSLKWVSKSRGVVQIPIEDAMNLLSK